MARQLHVRFYIDGQKAADDTPIVASNVASLIVTPPTGDLTGAVFSVEACRKAGAFEGPWTPSAGVAVANLSHPTDLSAVFTGQLVSTSWPPVFGADRYELTASAPAVSPSSPTFDVEYQKTADGSRFIAAGLVSGEALFEVSALVIKVCAKSGDITGPEAQLEINI